MVLGYQAIHRANQVTLADFHFDLVLWLGVPAVPTLNLQSVDALLQFEEAKLTPEST